MISKIKKLLQENDSNKPPIFIGGEGRSGTTLMRAMLNNHPNIFSGPETHFFIDEDFIKYRDKLIEKYAYRIREYNEDAVSEVNEMYRGMINNFFSKYMKKNNKKRWAEKTPYNIKHIDFLLEVFEGNIKFIHMIRDGRDVAASLLTMPWGPPTIEGAAESWNSIIENSRKHLEKKYFIEVKYEDLINNEVKVLKRVCKFLKEDYDGRMLDYYKDDDLGGSKESSYKQIKQPLYKNSIGRWQNDLTESQIDIFMNIARKSMRSLKYIK